MARAHTAKGRPAFYAGAAVKRSQVRAIRVRVFKPTDMMNETALRRQTAGVFVRLRCAASDKRKKRRKRRLTRRREATRIAPGLAEGVGACAKEGPCCP